MRQEKALTLMGRIDREVYEFITSQYGDNMTSLKALADSNDDSEQAAKDRAFQDEMRRG